MSNARPPAYAELHCVSNFSFLRGASHPEELIARAADLGYAALAITDDCSLAGAVRAHVAAGERAFELLIGTELTLSDGPRLVLLATNRDGYGNLSSLIARARRRAPKGGYRLHAADLDDGVPGCLALLIPERPAKTGLPCPAPETAAQHARWLAELFAGRAWLTVEALLTGGDRRHLAAMQALGRASGLPLVAAGDVHMHARSRRALQDTLTAIRLRTTVANAGHALFSNGERHLRTRERLAALYPPALLAETVAIAERCAFSLAELRYEYPEELVPAGDTPTSHLRALTEAGLRHRYPEGTPEKVRLLVERELALIAELRYEAFFLTVHDIVAYARRRGILCQGRGSAANSAVCYALAITEVDPAHMELLFERFVSRERNEPPDIDVDFEHERREEVIQYLYGKYGRERAALAATVITYQPRSAVRDVGKALGLEPAQVNALTRNLAWWDDRGALPERLRERGFDPAHPQMRQLVHLAGEIIGFPRHLSQHVGGFVIARDRLARLVPIENAAMAERTVIQWDKDDLEALGLLKVDVLALGMLSAIRRAFDLIRAHRGRGLSMASVPAEDPETYAMIQRGDTVGVFQIESRAQMAMLPRLKPANFYDLVIEIAIVRPGPIQGEMVHPYLRRRQGLETVSYPSEEVRAVLQRTLGVPLFQEQVIKLAMVAAGFTPGEADHLRRSMAAWRRNGHIAQFRQKLLDGMRARGYEEEFAERVYQQILGFGEYGFPESHSASFALITYVSAWLKCHEPAAFTCALLNSQPMGFYAPSQLVQDVRRHGVEVLPVDATVSDWDCTLERAAVCSSRREPDVSTRRSARNAAHGHDREGPLAIRLGLRMVKGLSQEAAARLTTARTRAPFADLTDLARRAELSRHDVNALAAADALATVAGNRRQTRWQALAMERPLPLLAETRIAEATPLLRPPGEGENIVADYGSTGLSLRRHPLALLRPHLARLRCLSGEALRALPHGTPVITAGLVITRQRPGTATGVVFLTLEDETGQINVIVWSSLVTRHRRVVTGAHLMRVEGEIQREGEVLHVIARRLRDYSPLLGELTVSSRDFH
ncbi:MAG: error-prone DNA polymerase [Gammaproteobacteria bacterium]